MVDTARGHATSRLPVAQTGRCCHREDRDGEVRCLPRPRRGSLSNGANMHTIRGPDEVPGRSRCRRLFHATVIGGGTVLAGVRTSSKIHLAVMVPILAAAGLAIAVTRLVASQAANPALPALLAGVSIIALLAWTRLVAIPFATKGKLPNGRNLADVLSRWQPERDRRKALRQRRNSPAYQGPHAHRRQHSLPPPDEDADPPTTPRP